ncbi:MAG: hypothetical protein JWM34_110 [Ilumatobacteraceae bacterium]|nr:hypothetical protein [Ilumatobacteraceae bacterium]
MVSGAVPKVWIEPTRVPVPLRTVDFVFEPLGPEHNERDHVAWMSSIDHVRATPGFEPELWGGDRWPQPMSIEQNKADLVMHRREFDQGEAFAYSVLRPGDASDGGTVIGCVYIDPDPTGECEAAVRCWVTSGVAELDRVLADSVAAWIASDWPIASVRFPGRGAV